MSYKLELSGEEQRALLLSTLNKWSNGEPDVFLITTEGHKIYTQRTLLSFYSNLLEELLSNVVGDLPGISVAVSSGSLVNLLKILTSGAAISNNRGHLMEVGSAAEVLGIKMENCQIGVKKKPGTPANTSASKVNRATNATYAKSPLAKVKIEPKAETKRKSPQSGLKPAAPKRTYKKKAKNTVADFAKPSEELNTKEAKEFKETSANLSLDEHVSIKGKPVFKEVPASRAKAANGKEIEEGQLEAIEVKRFPCDICGKDFKVQYALTRHEKIHQAGVDLDAEEMETEVQEGNIEVNDENAENIETNDKNAENIEANYDENAKNVEMNDGENPGNEDAEAVSKNIEAELMKTREEKLLEDRKKLMAELNSIEDENYLDLDF